MYYREEGGGDRRAFWLTLDSFDDESVWVAELTQYRSFGWDWVARYRLRRSPDVDRDYRIPQILEQRSRVVGGVRYGMTVDEVLARKGGHYKRWDHQADGSAYLVYDDAKVSVRGWYGAATGRVVGVEPTTEGDREYMKSTPYEDER